MTIYSNEFIDELIRISLINNPEIKAMQYDVKSKKSEIIASYAIPDPMISFEMMNFPVAGNDMTDPMLEKPMQEKKIGFTQTIPFPGKMILNGKAKKAEWNISKTIYNKMLINMKKEITVMYYMVALMDKKIEILGKQKSQTAMMLNLVKSKYESGKATTQDYLKVKLMESMIDKDILMMKLDRNNAIEGLYKMLGVSILPENIKFILDDVSEGIKFDREKIEGILKSYNYDRKIRELNIKKYKSQAQAMLWHLAPDFSFGFNFSFPNDGGAYFSFMAGAMIPLYFFSYQIPMARSEFAMEKMAENQLALEDNSLSEKINSNIEFVNKNIEILNLIKRASISDSQLSVDISFKEYQTDKIQYDMLLNGIVSLYSLYIEQEEIKFQILNSLETLKFLTSYKLEYIDK